MCISIIVVMDNIYQIFQTWLLELDKPCKSCFSCFNVKLTGFKAHSVEFRCIIVTTSNIITIFQHFQHFKVFWNFKRIHDGQHTIVTDGNSSIKIVCTTVFEVHHQQILIFTSKLYLSNFLFIQFCFHPKFFFQIFFF